MLSAISGDRILRVVIEYNCMIEYNRTIIAVFSLCVELSLVYVLGMVSPIVVKSVACCCYAYYCWHFYTVKIR
jgi:hypothetical protein